MGTLNEKTKVTLSLVLTILGALTVSFLWGMRLEGEVRYTANRVRENEKRFENHEFRQQDSLEKINEHLGSIQTDVAVIKSEVKGLRRR